VTPEEIFPIFFGTWVVLGAISFAIFFLGKNATLKRKLWPPFVIGAGILFVVFGYFMGFRGSTLYFIVPAVAVISILNLRATRFCDDCGKTIINQNFLAKPEFCSKCGAKLQ
jgi:hypothetical protein